MPTDRNTKIVTARFGDDSARTLAGYETTGGYQVLQEGARDDARCHHRTRSRRRTCAVAAARASRPA